MESGRVSSYLLLGWLSVARWQPPHTTRWPERGPLWLWGLLRLRSFAGSCRGSRSKKARPRMAETAMRSSRLLSWLAEGSRPPRPWFTVTVPPSLARVLVAAGAQRSSTPDAMRSATFATDDHTDSSGRSLRSALGPTRRGPGASTTVIPVPADTRQRLEALGRLTLEPLNSDTDVQELWQTVASLLESPVEIHSSS